MTRDEANSWLVKTLLEKIRADRFPSVVQMRLIEEALPQEMIPEYLAVLLEKVEEDSVPSVPMLQRIIRVSQSLPATESRGG